jgi:hypothetical protein
MSNNPTKSNNLCDCDHKHAHKYSHYTTHQGGNAFYGLGMIGAAIFYLSQATTFGLGVLAVLKAIVWPVFFVYEALHFLVG